MQAKRQRLNDAAAVSRSQVVLEAQTIGVEVFQCTGYNSTHTNEEYVTDLYEAFLQRAPDGPGLGYWVQNTQSNGRAATLSAFKTSTEYNELAGTLYRETFWLVGDQLGTPRMVADKSGSLAGIKRHDYLPFGEELYANMGGRTTTQGYSAVDNVRQKFTGYERDGETNLDYAQARYYANSQGRFTSADPLFMTGSRLGDPQQLNIYTYARNNPMKFTDPTGLDVALEGTQQGEYVNDLNKRDKAAFTVANINNKVTIVDAKGNALGKAALKALGKTLSGGEAELFKAITDTKTHATIDTGNGQPNENVLFGRNDMEAIGGARGRNTLDMSEIKLLDSPENKGGISAGDAVAHETLEAYVNAQGKSPDAAHDFAGQHFGSIEQIPSSQGLTGHPDFFGRYRTGVADFYVLKPDGSCPIMRTMVTFPHGVNPNVDRPPIPFNVTKVERVP
jgi:RHS repeat-associated protein